MISGTKFGQSFFGSTRGQVLELLRRGIRTVDGLAAELGVTNNAVRAHLTTLERDGLIERRGTQPGSRKPHLSYELTSEAEQLFPKAYSTLFNQLLTTLKRRLPPDDVKSMLSEVAKSLAEGNTAQENDTTEERAARAVATFESLGGSPAVKNEDGKLAIFSVTSCPLDNAVSQHPEVCQLAEAYLTEVTGLKVREQCQKGEHPKCSFEIVEEKGD